VISPFKQAPTESTFYRPVIPNVIGQLETLWGPKRVSTAKANRDARSFDVSGHPSCLIIDPPGLFFPPNPGSDATILKQLKSNRATAPLFVFIHKEV